MDNTTTTTVFRFKFSEEINNELLSFSKIHQHDDRNTYKDNWNIWIRQNSDLITNETHRLVELGYDGDVIDKMYKSGRYYFRKKTPKKEPKKRRVYVSIDSEIIDSMDNHIQMTYNMENIKPIKAYELFVEENSNVLDIECNRLKEFITNNDEIKRKIKKTYKNRYYLFSTNKSIGDNNSSVSNISDLTDE